MRDVKAMPDMSADRGPRAAGGSPDDIVFVIPPSRWRDSRYSLGVMYVSSYLRKNGYGNAIIDDRIMGKRRFSSDEAMKAIVRRIGAMRPRFVGVTCLINELREAVEVVKAVKAESPGTTVLAGGTQPTDTPGIFLRNGVDYVVLGEGEATTLELINKLDSGKPPDEVRGIAFLSRGKVRLTGPRPLMEDLDEIPYPSFDLVNMERHLDFHEWVLRGLPMKTGLVMTSRGCPYSCTFCECNKLFGRKVRHRSYGNIYGEVKLLRDMYGAEAIWFVDDTLTLDKGHLFMVCRIMRELGMRWACQGRVNTVDDEMIRVMKSSGCIQIDFGVESGSDRVLRDIIDKRITTSQTREAFRLCRKHGMRTLANIMIGLPTETREEMLKTYSLAREIGANSYVLSITLPLPNTRLWDIVDPDISEDEMYKLNFFDSELLPRFNRSGVKDLVSLRKAMLTMLNNHRKLGKTLSLAEWYARIFHGTKHKGGFIRYIAGSYLNFAYAVVGRLRRELAP
ncbi:MAG: B12-binding domain-containing radical SAM protein [Candidatus Aenigmarchaeota archaeon]|nr:B12-binding domain-containing radical SAM protein [Candidatus Aenigmarchaeota archaeon]